MLTGNYVLRGDKKLLLVRHPRHRAEARPLVHPRTVGRHRVYGRNERGTVVRWNHGTRWACILIRTSASEHILLLVRLVHQRWLRLHLLHVGLLLGRGRCPRIYSAHYGRTRLQWSSSTLHFYDGLGKFDVTPKEALFAAVAVLCLALRRRSHVYIAS